MSETTGVKQKVRNFYDQVGWQVEADGHYQNARYEDLRPVSRDYIHRCHLRVQRHLKPRGRFLLDAGSGPVQYPEYVTYSQGYQYRVCADLSIVALKEARSHLGPRGLYVVADVANLPFASEPFDGVVSLHTLHHLPLEEQEKAYGELHRVLKPGSQAVVVNGWTDSPLMRRSTRLVRLAERVGSWWARRVATKTSQPVDDGKSGAAGKGTVRTAPAGVIATRSNGNSVGPKNETGTFIRKLDAAWLQDKLGGRMKFEIFVWRSVSVRFLRALVHDRLGGRVGLRLLFWLEERFPRFFGEKGQYPLIVIHKD